MNTSENISGTSQKLSLVKKSEVEKQNSTKPLIIKKSANLSNFNQKLDVKNNLKLKKKTEIDVVVEDPNFIKIDEKHFQFDALKEMKKPETLWEYNPEVVDKAYKIICKMWNKDQKSRNFVKHLVSAFLPYNPWNRLMFVPDETKNQPIRIDTNDLKTEFKCAILNHKVTGIKNIASGITPHAMKKMSIDCHCSVEGRDKYTDTEIEELTLVRSMIPVEIIETRVGVSSETSTKYLQVEAVQALLIFSTELMWHNDELNFTVRKNMINRAQENVPKEKQLKPKQVNQIVGQQIYGMDHKVDTKTYSALEKLKLELDKQENN